MDKLIEALEIFKKYVDSEHPITCALKTLMINHITKDIVSEEDQKRLKELNFKWDEEYECWLMDLPINNGVKSLKE